VQHQRLGGVNDTTVAPSKWTKLGFVEGAGSRSKSSHYQHEIGALKVGRHAFRLQKIGKSGSAQPTKAKQVAVRLEEAYALTPPYPNPVKGQARLDLTVRKKQRVTVQIYDVLGRRVATPHRGTLEASDPRQIELPTRRLSSGAYFVRIDGKHFTTTTRMTVVR